MIRRRDHVPVGSRVTLRLYGEVGALSVAETVSGRTEDLGAASDSEQSFDIARDGELRIDGPGGEGVGGERADRSCRRKVEVPSAMVDVTFDGQMSQPIPRARRLRHVGGTARFDLDMAAVERRYGLGPEPEPRAPIELDLPMPITGDRAEFSETLIENLSKHPWAHLPVTLQIAGRRCGRQIGSQRGARDASFRRGGSLIRLAAAVIEQRRDLLWSRENGKRVVQVLRAVSYRPEDGLFRRKRRICGCG